MAQDPEKTDWSKVNALTRPDNSNELVSQSSIPQSPTPESMQGVITRLRANGIQRKAALEAMKAATSARLEVFNHQLQEAVKTKKAEATMLTDQVLADLDGQYQAFLSEIGVRNEAVRNDTLKKLGDETARSLKEIQGKDWPDFMITETIKVITDRYNKFLDRLRGELTDER